MDQNPITPVVKSPVFEIKKNHNWSWILLGALFFAIFLGFGVTGIISSFDLFGGPSSPAENLFSTIGTISFFGAIIYFSVVSYKFNSYEDLTRRIYSSIAKVILGIVLTLIFAIPFVLLYSSMNIIEIVDQKIVQRNEDKRQSSIQNANVTLSIEPIESNIFKIDEKFTMIELKAIPNGLDALTSIENLSNYLFISGISINGKIVELPNSDPWTNSPSGYTYGTDQPTTVTSSDNNTQISFKVIVPTDKLGKANSQGVYAIEAIVELWSQSPNTALQDTLWSGNTSFIARDAGVYVTDFNYHISYTLPVGSARYTSIDSKGNMINDPSNHSNFTLTTNPKMSLCCETSEFKATDTGKRIPLQQYLNNLSWKDEIIESKIQKFSDRMAAVITANPTIASPYKAIIIGTETGDMNIQVFELTDKNAELEKVFDQYKRTMQLK